MVHGWHRALASPGLHRRTLIPREAMVVFALASPMLALLMSRAVLFGPWHEGVSILAFCVFTCTTIAGALCLVFDGVLSHLACVKRRHPARFALYAIIAAAVAACIMWPSAVAMRSITPELGAQPIRRVVQAIIVTYFYLALTLVFKRMCERITAEHSRAVTERAAALTARLQALQARTNPHFLFNTLNSIMSLVAGRPSQAENMIGLLAKHIRYALEGSERSFVALGVELDAVRDYLGIEQVRFGPRLRVDIAVATDVDLEMHVPPMVLQPLAENAVLHSVSRRIAGGTVRVAVQRRPGDGIDLSVVDDGADAGSSAHIGTRTSLANLRERLLLVYGGRAALMTSYAAGGGFCARVTLPASRLS
jgi:two-component system sensor histidine kinase AlgZ